MRKIGFLTVFMVLGVFALLIGCAEVRQPFSSGDAPVSDGTADGEPTGQSVVPPPTTTFSSTQSVGRFVSSGGFLGYVSLGAISGPKSGSENYEMFDIPVAAAAGLGLDLSISEVMK